MNLGELKIACYKLINPADEELVPENINEYEKNVNYSYYFLNMINSINGAISRIVQETILPLQRFELDCTIFNTENLFVTIKMSDYIDNIYKLRLIEYKDSNGNRRKIDYRVLGNYLDILNEKEGYYVFYYYPKINALETYSDLYNGNINNLDLEELDINDNIANIIPLYVKGDLLEHDRSTEAVLAKNTFDQYIQSFEIDEIEEFKAKKQVSWWGEYL